VRWDHQESDRSIDNPSLAIIILNFVYIVISLVAAVIEFGIEITGLCNKVEPISQSLDLYKHTSAVLPADRKQDFFNRSLVGEESFVQLKTAANTSNSIIQPINLNMSITDMSQLENHEVVRRNKRLTLVRNTATMSSHFRRNSSKKDLEHLQRDRNLGLGQIQSTVHSYSKKKSVHRYVDQSWDETEQASESPRKLRLKDNSPARYEY